VPTMSNSEEKKFESYVNPGKVSLLSKFLQGNSDAMGVVGEFLGLNGNWVLSRVSQSTKKTLTPYIIKQVHCLLVEGLVIWYLNYYGKWVLAIVACVFNDGTGNQAYHITPVKRGETETLFDHEVPCRTSMNSYYSEYPVPIRMIFDRSAYPAGNPKLHTHYGNGGSRTAKNAHDMCERGLVPPCCHAPFPYRSTVDPRCYVFPNESLCDILEKHAGRVMNTNDYTMDDRHLHAIEYLTEQRPGMPVNRPNGYSPEAVKALFAYDTTPCRMGSDIIGKYGAEEAARRALGTLYKAMPDIPWDNEQNTSIPCECQYPYPRHDRDFIDFIVRPYSRLDRVKSEWTP
jgi:hypothetical protein